MTIINLADVTNDNRMISPAQLLRNTADEIESGNLKCTKCAVLTLDNENDAYDTHFRCSNIKASETITLLTLYITEFTDILRGLR